CPAPAPRGRAAEHLCPVAMSPRCTTVPPRGQTHESSCGKSTDQLDDEFSPTHHGGEVIWFILASTTKKSDCRRGGLFMRFRAGLASFIAGPLLLVTSGSASATVITFEGPPGQVFTVGGFIDVSGFRFTLTAAPVGGFELVTAQSNIVEP